VADEAVLNIVHKIQTENGCKKGAENLMLEPFKAGM
jgi:hypothetical protein